MRQNRKSSTVLQRQEHLTGQIETNKVFEGRKFFNDLKNAFLNIPAKSRKKLENPFLLNNESTEGPDSENQEDSHHI